MSKKMLVLALSLMATVLLAANSFGQACGSGINVHYVGIGSSAQFNTLSFGAADALAALPGYAGVTNVWTSKSAQVIDSRPAPNLIDTGLSIWVLFDSLASGAPNVCNVYIGYQADSVQGVKDFYCSSKVPAGFIGVRAGCFGHSTGAGSWETLACVNVVPGKPCAGPANLPLPIQTFLITQPAPTKVGTVQQLPPSYCGQSFNTAGKVGTNTFYCYFNAAHTDVRDEDALFATNRALSSYNTTNSLYGLGYNQVACGAQAGNKVGCPIYDSFNKGKVFFPLAFAIKGADPISAATPVPTNTTITLGASPVVVFVNNADTTNSLGFGVKQQDGNYLYMDILAKKLAEVFEGVSSCTGDILPTIPTPAGFGGTIPGLGAPIQAVIREPLSGTYNTFEFTGVRMFKGSGLNANAPTGVMVGLNKVTTATTGSGPTWLADQESGQEIDVRDELPLGPATNFGNAACPVSGAGFPTGAVPCGDPLWYQTGAVAGSHGTGCGKGLKLRAIGTGEEVAATLGTDNGGASVVTDGIGYAFWGYSNFKPAASGCSTVAVDGGTGATCTTNIGHYMTVDAIDPLFLTEGGAFSPTLGPNPENWNGAYNLPQCAFIQGIAGSTFPCPQIPFPHLYDGKYALWSMLRVATFANVAPTATLGDSHTPEGVINVLGFAQQEAAPGSASQLSDFAPFLNSLAGLPYNETNPQATCGAGGNPACPTGDLNIGVFRSHYEQSGVVPDNGHKGCAPGFSFVGVALQGGTAGHATCLVDQGGDVGGVVLTVNNDVDFYEDLGDTTVGGAHYPSEIYNLHQ